jgi:hypothetical protein
MIGKADAIVLGLVMLLAGPILAGAVAFGIYVAVTPAPQASAVPLAKSQPADGRPDPNRFTQADLAAMELLITSRGFSCRKATRMRDMLFGGGFVVHCDDRPGVEYWFNVEDHGGKWTVESKGFGQ